MNRVISVLAIVVMLALTQVAWAGGSNGNNGRGNECQGNSCGGVGGAGGNAKQGQGQAQGQLQGQLQGQAQATLVGVGVRTGQATDVSQGNLQQINIDQADNQATVDAARALADGQKGVYSDYVASAYGPPLAATGDCLGSASAGGSSSVMGFSIGKTYVDENCNARRDSIHLASLGEKFSRPDLVSASVMRLCSQPEMAKVIAECVAAEAEAAKEPVDAAKWYDNQ